MRHPGLLLALFMFLAAPAGAAAWPPAPEEVAAISHVGTWAMEEQLLRDRLAETEPSAVPLGRLAPEVLAERVARGGDAPAYTARSMQFLLRGDPDKARADFDRALRKDAAYVPALYLRGLAQERAGRFEKAREDYRRAGEQGGSESPFAQAAVANLAMILDSLPAAQGKVAAQYGAPPRFVVQVFAAGGERPVRLETWDYPAEGRSYTFLDGRLAGEDRIDRDRSDHVVGLHRPWQLVSGTTFADAVTLLREDRWYHLELADEVVAGGDLLVTNHLVLGFKGGGLFYARSEPLVLE